MSADARPVGPPPLRRPVTMDQVWADAVFLHWRVDSALVAPWMPNGARPDEHDGSSWIGLIGFRMQDAGFGYDHPVPWSGTFGEINVRLSYDSRRLSPPHRGARTSFAVRPDRRGRLPRPR